LKNSKNWIPTLGGFRDRNAISAWAGTSAAMLKDVIRESKKKKQTYSRFVMLYRFSHMLLVSL